jgi:hypothetical protein
MLADCRLQVAEAAQLQIMPRNILDYDYNYLKIPVQYGTQ